MPEIDGVIGIQPIEGFAFAELSNFTE